MASAYIPKRQTSDGQYLVYMAWADRHGRRRNELFGKAPSRKAAERLRRIAGEKARQRETRERAASGPANTGAVKVSDIITRYLATLEGRPSLVKAEWAAEFINEELGGTYIFDLRVKEVRDFLEQLEGQKGPRGRTITAASVNEVQKVLQAAINKARRDELYAGENVAALAGKLKAKKPTQDYLRPDEIGAFLDAATDNFRTLFAVLTYQGLRPGEAFALTVDDVDTSRWLLSITKSWDRDTTKTGTHRHIPVLEPARPFLLKAMKGKKRGELLWPHTDGGMRPRTHGLGTVMRQTLKRAKIDRHIRPYDLRHTCATLLRAQGYGRDVVGKFLGHSDSAITERVYQHGEAEWLAQQLEGAWK